MNSLVRELVMVTAALFVSAAEVSAQPIVYASADAAANFMESVRDERSAESGSVSAQAANTATTFTNPPIAVGRTSSQSSARFSSLNGGAAALMNTEQQYSGSAASAGTDSSWGDRFSIVSASQPAGTLVRFRVRLELAGVTTPAAGFEPSVFIGGVAGALARATVSGFGDVIGTVSNQSWSIGIDPDGRTVVGFTETSLPVAEHDVMLTVGSTFDVWHQLVTFANVTGVVQGSAQLDYSSRFSLVPLEPGADYVTASGTRYDSPIVRPVLANPEIRGRRVTLSWSPVGGEVPASSYRVLVRSAPGGGLLTSFPVGTNLTLSLTAPFGTYYVTVAAVVGQQLVESDEVEVEVARPGRPAAPTNLVAHAAGRVVTLSWGASSSGGGPILTYLLEVGRNAGGRDVVLPVGVRPTLTTPPLPNGTYYVRVRAVGAGGFGPPSNEVRIRIGPLPTAGTR